MLLFTMLFLWCPIFGILAYAVYLGHHRGVSIKAIWALAVMLSLYLGCLGTTKELLGDFLTYKQIFDDVPNDDLWSYILSFGKEPVYYGYTYLAYYLYMGNWSLFVFSLTTLNYLLLSYCILRIGSYLQTSSTNLIISLFFMAFFFQEFAAIGNMLRQGLAQSITLAFLVRWYIDKKKSWWIALIALGVHTSCLPLLGIGVLPVLQKRLRFHTFIQLGILLLALAIIFLGMSSWLSTLPFVGYIFERVSNHEQLLAADAWQTEVGLQPSMIMLLALLGGMVIYLYRPKEEQRLPPAMYVFVNFNLILLLMMVVCNALGMYYLLMRYFFYLYAFQNTLFLLFVHEYRFFRKTLVRWGFVSVMMVYFYYQFSHNIFSYIPVLEALVNPFPLYFI